jgi:nucleoside-diphosphate-sugar epimerase
MITGCTGFVGKVLLEKLLREVPTIDKVYVFVRTKKDQLPEERLNTQIIGSRIWERLHLEKGTGFDAWIKSKLVVIPGDSLSAILQECSLIPIC